MPMNTKCRLIIHENWKTAAYHTSSPRAAHWLPVRLRIDFKLAVPVHKALHGQLPQYLAEDCQFLTDIGRRSLRSADVLTCATKEHERVSETVFPSLDHVSGTLCLSHYVTEISHLYSLRDFWRYFGLWLRRIVTVAFFAPCSYILTYLLMMSGPNSPNLNPLDYQVWGQRWSLNTSCDRSQKQFPSLKMLFSSVAEPGIWNGGGGLPLLSSPLPSSHFPFPIFFLPPLPLPFPLLPPLRSRPLKYS